MIDIDLGTGNELDSQEQKRLAVQEVSIDLITRSFGELREELKKYSEYHDNVYDEISFREEDENDDEDYDPWHIVIDFNNKK